MWSCPERREQVVDCLYLELECPSRLLDNVDRGLMKNDELGRLKKKNEPYVRLFFSSAFLSPQRRYFSQAGKITRLILHEQFGGTPRRVCRFFSRKK